MQPSNSLLQNPSDNQRFDMGGALALRLRLTLLLLLACAAR